MLPPPSPALAAPDASATATASAPSLPASLDSGLPAIQPGTYYDTPSRAALPVSAIVFCHPGYDAPFNRLFSLRRVESASPPRGPWGVHYLTALTACQIIANNAFDGYLVAEEADGPRIVADNDSILTQNRYYFIVPDKPIYAVVPSFQEWQFPGSVPQAWQDAAAATMADDMTLANEKERCVVSGRFIVEAAHLCPKQEKTWFLNNAMTRYDSHQHSNVYDCPSNQILLDCSLHTAMDKRLWAFTPRHQRFAVQTISLPESLTHDALSEFVHEYHGRYLRPEAMRGTEVEYLFARFAWAVLYLVKEFILLARPKITLARYRVWEDGATRVKEQDMLAKDVDLLYGGGGTRSATPRKRSRISSSDQGQDEVESSDQGQDEVLCGNVYDWIGRVWHDTTVSEDEERGRKRTRDEAVRYGKRRRTYASVSAVPSLGKTGSSTSISGVPASPRPGSSLPVEHDARPKEEHDQDQDREVAAW